ncbi:MAG TPA: hypothetical protein DEF61_00510 [Firmicutes bacterium]|nr:hypothetical protein [Bacillota bacterium]
MKEKLLLISLSMLLCSCGGELSSTSFDSSNVNQESSDSSIIEADSSSNETESSSVGLPTSDEYFELSNDGKSFTLIKCPEPFAKEYEIPSIYKNLPVRGISKSAFGMTPFLQKLFIPNSVEYIEKGAFTNFSNYLEELTTPFIGTSLTDSNAYLGEMFGIGNVVGKNATSIFAPNFKKLTITNQEVLPDGCLSGATTLETISILNCKQIGVGALSHLDGLTSLTLEDGLLKIGSGAFSDDKNLKELSIPDSVNQIDDQAFFGLPFSSFELPKSLSKFTYYQDMPNLKEWIISDDNEYFLVDDGVLYSKDFSTLVNFPVAKDASSFIVNPNTTIIGPYAFKGTNISSFSFQNISRVESFSFFGAERLAGVAFGDQLSYVGDSAFYGNTNLLTLTFAKTIKEGTPAFSWEHLAFASCIKLKEVVLPSYVSMVPDSAFAGDTSLSKLTLEGSMTYLGLLSFSNTNIKELSVTFADKASLGSNLFKYVPLDNLYLHFDNVVTYPTISSLGIGATPHIYVDSEEEATALKQSWSNSISTAALILKSGTETKEFSISDGTLIKYDVSSSFNKKRIIIPDGVTSIAANVFNNLGEVEYIYVPSSVTRITSSSFANCPKLLEIEFGHDDITAFSVYQANGKEGNFYSAFNFDGSNKTVFAIKNKDQIETFKNRFTSMYSANVLAHESSDLYLDYENYTLYNLEKSILLSYLGDKTSYLFDDMVTTIGKKAFYGSNDLEEIDFNNVSRIEDSAFGECEKLSELDFGEKVGFIGDSAFAYCNGLTSLSFKGATEIGNNAFYMDDSYSLTSIDFGKKLSSIGSGAFYGAFSNCEIVIPSSCLKISDDAFNCFSQDENSSIYFENNVDAYCNDDDFEWVTCFVDDYARSNNGDIVVAFYSENIPDESYSSLSCSFWHYDENNSKVLY